MLTPLCYTESDEVTFMHYISCGTKISLTLSEKCYSRLESDADVFGFSKSKLIENIIIAYCKDADFIADLFDEKKVKKKQSQLTALYSSENKIYFEKTMAKLLLNKTADRSPERITRKHTFVKTKTYSWTVTATAASQLKYDELSYVQGGAFICELLEEYVSLPYSEREFIQLAEITALINSHIRNKKAFSYVASGNTWFTIHPYKIITDPDLQYNYVIGHIVKKDSPEEADFVPCYENVGCVRLFNIYETGKKTVPAKIDKAALERKLSTHQPAFMSQERVQVEVLLTDGGVRLFRAVLPNRPKVISKEENYIYKGKSYFKYTVSCTPFQARIYFGTFGAYAKIISPDFVVEGIKRQLSDALKMYDDVDTEG